MPASKKTKVKESNGKEYIVAIGASAGGLEAIHDLFDNMPDDTNFSFVIIQHLSPDYKSLMGELLSKHTAMQVYEAQDRMPVQKNCIYLIPSKKIMTIENGVLRLKDKIRDHLPNTAIDIFFESLAKENGKKAIGIILSGTGTDGTKGVEAIKNSGGIVVVQDPITAAFDGMPNSAISAGYADLILPPEMIPEELIDFLKEAPLLKSFNTVSQKDEQSIKDILELVHKETNYDFSHYKRPTIHRRLVKRMAERNMKSVEEYFTFLNAHPGEIKLLAKEFLIGVTKFFRDEEAFEEIQTQVIPAIFLNKKPEDHIKLWVVACSSGEEAYSLAILLQDYITRYKKEDANIKIFATDIDKDALETASRAIYPEESLKHLSSEKLSTYFIKEGNLYRVAPIIRKMVVFAHHDVLKDPPFSRLDLISCRNMLIYMSPVLQKNILKTFHFALNSGGYLFLGPSENIGILKDVVKEIDRKWKIFKCIEKSRMIDHEPFVSPSNRKIFTQYSPTSVKSKNALNYLSDIFRETLLEEHKYAGIYIDKDFDVKQAIGNFKHFLNFPDEHFHFNLLKLVPSDLSVALSITVRKAIKENQKAVLKSVKIRDGKIERYISIIVKPYLEHKDYMQPFLFVILHEEEYPVNTYSQVIPEGPEYINDRIRELENELRETKQNLQAVIEEVESANEELQSSNEEIVSSNEELQSTNEELQSLNEELHTVNTEHQIKIKELIELNDDLNNYFRNSDIGQILLDKKLMIRKFSPAISRQINLIETDVGRSIIDISTNFISGDFINEIKKVIKSGKSFQKEVVTTDGSIFLMKINPYIKQDNSTEGVVINFIDVSEIKKLNSIIEGVFNSSTSGITAKKAVRDDNNKIVDFEYIASNIMADRIMNVDPGNLRGKYLLREFPQVAENYFERYVRVVESGEAEHFEFYNDSTRRWFEVICVKMLDGLVTTFTDITQKKHAADLLQRGYVDLKNTSDKLLSINQQLEQSNFDLLQFASVASHDLKEPLRKIQAFGNLLNARVDGKLDESEKRYLDKIINSSNRMQTLVEDVLTLSKLSNKDIPYNNVNLNKILSRIVDDLEITIKEKKATVEIGVFPEIEAVPGQIHQLFQNLISNGLKFNDKPEVKISISPYKISEEEARRYGIDPRNYIGLSVEDNGIGFEEQFTDKIFGVFQRLHSQDYQGTGIGLAICKKIVDNHNGFITARSRLHEGSRFIVMLPVKKVRERQAVLN
jgi:two-component system CheB/CheR fusion protein